MDEPRRRRTEERANDGPVDPEISLIAAWRAAKSAPNYREEAARQATSAASADVEDRVMEWIEGVAAEAWDDL
jgi:hypothetical protein